MSESTQSHTGFSPSMTSCSKELRPDHARSILYKLQLGLAPDFKFELLPLHSPLLGQSLLVSFPPLIDMLKFSGYSYLIRGQPCNNNIGGILRQEHHQKSIAREITTLGVTSEPATDFQGLRQPQVPNTSLGLDG